MASFTRFRVDVKVMLESFGFGVYSLQKPGFRLLILMTVLFAGFFRPSLSVGLKPATSQQLRASILQATLGLCFLRKRSVDYEIALAANAAAIVSLLKARHGLMLEENPQPFNPTEIARFLNIEISLQAEKRCPSLLLPKTLKKINQMKQLLHRQRGEKK